MSAKNGHIVILCVLFTVFSWFNSTIATGQSDNPYSHEGDWGEYDEQADMKNSRGLEIPANWQEGANWTVFATPTTRALPPVYVWRTQNPIRDQGWCGSCWAFATTSVVESLGVLTRQGRFDLSEQATLSCSKAGICRGGFFDAFNYLTYPGTTSEAVFPYAAQDLACPYGLPPVMRLYSWSYIGQPGREPSIQELKAAIYSSGPIAVAVSGSFGAYTGGVFDKCTQSPLDHMVNIEGWDDTKQAWRVRNSWGTAWGERGWAWVKYTDSQGRKCNRIGEIAAFAVLAKPLSLH